MAVAVEERRVDVAGVRDHLDHRVILRLHAEAEAERDLRAEARAAVGGDRQRDERRRAVGRAARRDDAIARREQVDPGRLRVGRQRGLPVVGVRAEQSRADPASGGFRRRLRRQAERATRLSLNERIDALRRELALVLRLERTGPRRRGVHCGPAAPRARVREHAGRGGERQGDGRNGSPTLAHRAGADRTTSRSGESTSYAPSSARSGPVSSGSKPIRPAISSLDGFVPSRKSSRRRSPVSLLAHHSSPTSRSR